MALKRSEGYNIIPRHLSVAGNKKHGNTEQDKIQHETPRSKNHKAT